MIVCLGGAIMQGLLLFVCAAHSVIYFDVHDDCLGRAVFSVQVNVIAGSTSKARSMRCGFVSGHSILYM